MAAPRNKFTDEQIEELRKSQYVLSVSELQVYFTAEFKRLFWQMYTEENMMPYEILRRLGINYYTLGKRRVLGLTHNLKIQYALHGDFRDKRDIKKSPRVEEKTTEQLRAENEYLRQELEFVKKIIAAGGVVKR